MTISQETSIPYINTNAFPKASFHSFELVSMIHNALEPESRWPAILLMVAREMLKFGYKLSQGLGVVGLGSPTLIELLYNKGQFSLGYEPTHEELFQTSRRKKRKFASPGVSIPYIKTIFSAPAKVIMP